MPSSNFTKPIQSFDEDALRRGKQFEKSALRIHIAIVNSLRAKSVKIIVASLTCCLSCVLPNASPLKAIIGGTQDSISTNFVVALHRPGSMPFCTGTLVAPTWVITAAHCIWDDTIGSISPYLNSLKVSTTSGFSGANSSSSQIRSAVAHPSYTNWRSGFDIALLKVDDVFGGSFATIASNDEVRSYSDTFSSVIATGFGNTTDSGNPSPVALQTSLTLLPSNICGTWHSSELLSMSSTILCASGSSNSATCNGDSGGPLFLNTPNGRRLIGAVSFGSTPCSSSRTRYTNLVSFVSFMNSYGIALPVSSVPQTPVVVALPQLPNPPTLPAFSPIFQNPVLPTVDGKSSRVLPKFSVSRTFQLLLNEASTNVCEIDIDGPLTLNSKEFKVFVGKSSTKPYTRGKLNSFGDLFFKAKKSCAQIRREGVFIMADTFSTRIKVVE